MFPRWNWVQELRILHDVLGRRYRQRRQEGSEPVLKGENLLFTSERQPPVHKREIMPHQHYSNAKCIAESADNRKHTVTDLSGGEPVEILTAMTNRSLDCQKKPGIASD